MQPNHDWIARDLRVWGVLLSVVSAGAVYAQSSEHVAADTPAKSSNPKTSASGGKTTHVVIETDKGRIDVELFTAKAPQSVANVLSYIKSKHYIGTIFHRVVPGFVVQGGGFTSDMKQKETRSPVVNESNNGLSNKRGTVALARRSDPDSATSQFYINLSDNVSLDYGARSAGAPGYTVFGKVVKGMEVVDAIAGVALENRGRFAGVPKEPVRIIDVTVKDDG